jgi:hypothetical protein
MLKPGIVRVGVRSLEGAQCEYTFSTLEEKKETGTFTNHEIKMTLEVDMC